MSLIFTLASRNLFHDRLRLVATVIGIVFSIVLVTVQMGLYLGFGRMVTTMIDHAPADLWIMPRGTKCFEDPSLLDDRKRFRALSVAGVSAAVPVVIGFAEWRHAGRRHDAGIRRRLRPAWRPDCCPGTWSKAASTRCRFRMRSRSTRSYFDSARRDGHRLHRRDPRAEGAGGGGDQAASARSPRRPMSSRRSTARAPTPASPRPSRPISSCASRPAPTSRMCAAGCRQHLRRRGPDHAPSSASAAAPSGCSTPAPARPCSPARCSA